MDDFFPKDPVLPSSVLDERWIYVRSPTHNDVLKHHLKNKEDITFGKWMIFNDSRRISLERGMTRHDYAWQFIKRLVENNCSSVSGLMSAKCSTSYVPDCYSKDSNGLICCYTFDCTDKRTAKIAADAIRNVYHYPRDMFYKTDEDTLAKNYRHLGSTCISLYKHTTENQLFERDKFLPYRWNYVGV